MSAPYRPIDCSLYDRYEAWATRGTLVRILLLDPPGGERILTTRITDLQARGGVEHMYCEDGTVVRLDHVLRVEEADADG